VPRHPKITNFHKPPFALYFVPPSQAAAVTTKKCKYYSDKVSIAWKSADRKDTDKPKIDGTTG
jgi:hypothetical protein